MFHFEATAVIFLKLILAPPWFRPVRSNVLVFLNFSKLSSFQPLSKTNEQASCFHHKFNLGCFNQPDQTCCHLNLGTINVRKNFPDFPPNLVVKGWKYQGSLLFFWELQSKPTLNFPWSKRLGCAVRAFVCFNLQATSSISFAQKSTRNTAFPLICSEDFPVWRCLEYWSVV